MRVADRHGRGNLRGNQRARHAESKQLAYTCTRLHGTCWCQHILWAAYDLDTFVKHVSKCILM